MPLLEDLGSKIPKTGVQALSIVVDFDVFENRFRGTSELTTRSDKCATGKRGSAGMEKPKRRSAPQSGFFESFDGPFVARSPNSGQTTP